MRSPSLLSALAFSLCDFWLLYLFPQFRSSALKKKSGAGIAELCGSRILPLPDNGAKFIEISKIDEDGPSRASRLSKTFPEVPIIFDVSSGNVESQQGIVLGLGVIKSWLGTWDAPELFAVSGSFNSLASSQELSSVSPEFGSKVDSPLSNSSLVV